MCRRILLGNDSVLFYSLVRQERGEGCGDLKIIHFEGAPMRKINQLVTVSSRSVA